MAELKKLLTARELQLEKLNVQMSSNVDENESLRARLKRPNGEPISETQANAIHAYLIARANEDFADAGHGQ